MPNKPSGKALYVRCYRKYRRQLAGCHSFADSLAVRVAWHWTKESLR